MRLIEVGAIGEAVPRLVRAGRPRSRVESSHDINLASPGGVTGKCSAEALGGRWSFYV